MDGLTNEIAYYTATFAIGAAAGCSRKLRDRRARHFSYILCVASVSGFSAFSIVGLLVYHGFSSGVAGLAVASLVGLTNRELNEVVLQKLMDKFMPDESKE